jgi:cobalamin biosynthesis Mg chelatase CobN
LPIPLNNQPEFSGPRRGAAVKLTIKPTGWQNMNDLQKEIGELKEFMADLKADRLAVKQKEKAEAWTKYVSLTVVIIAVIAAVAAQRSGKYGGQVQMDQLQASDDWSFYQAKSIKQHLDESALVQLLETGNTNSPPVAAEIKKLAANVTRYDSEKADLQAKAKDLEKKRDEASARGGRMGLAVSILSVSIATASICTVTKKKPLWFVAMVMAAVAVVEMVVAWVGKGG